MSLVLWTIVCGVYGVKVKSISQWVSHLGYLTSVGWVGARGACALVGVS